MSSNFFYLIIFLNGINWLKNSHRKTQINVKLLIVLYLQLKFEFILIYNKAAMLGSVLHAQFTFAWVSVASSSYFFLGLCCITILLLLGSVLHHHITFTWVCVASSYYFCLCLCCKSKMVMQLGSVLHHYLNFAWICVASPSYFCLGLCCITILLLLGSVLHHHITFAWICVASPFYKSKMMMQHRPKQK
jgi:hypothetical protein